jgi:hypothetical protein
MSAPQCPTCGASLDGPLWVLFVHQPACRELDRRYRQLQADIADRRLLAAGLVVTRAS